MKNRFFGILVLVTVLFSLSLTVFAGEVVPCPPGKSCSENYILGPVPIGVKTPEKQKTSPLEDVARIAALEKALERDNDKLIKKFFYTSKSGICLWSTPQDEYYNWLIQNTDVVVDRKEFPAPSHRTTTVSKYNGSASSECTTMLVVHYHKIAAKEVKEK